MIKYKLTACHIISLLSKEVSYPRTVFENTFKPA